MADEVQIRQFRLADQEKLLSFLGAAYADEPRKSDREFWTWHYLQNPHTKLDDIPLWVVTDNDRIVGQLATIPVVVNVNEEEKPAIWVLDFVVLPEYRGKGLGKRLVLAALESYAVVMTLGINEASTAVFRSLKWVPLEGLHRYHRLLYPGDAFGEIARLRPFRSMANLAYAPFRPRDAQMRYTGQGVIREITAFDEAFTDLWQRASKQWPCAVVRSPAFLEWQYRRQPGKKFEVLGLYEHDQLMGYVVVFFRKVEGSGALPKGAITDICYDASRSQQVVDELLKAAVRLALKRRAGSLVTDVLNPLVESRLQQFGFWRIKASPQFMATTSEHPDLIYNPGNWYLTRGDSDVSIFEQPNL
jgi:GNAT superfamily N-acetyltransferase